MQKAEAKYKAIFEALKEEILGGKYSATRKLPSEAQLMRRFGGSRVTVIHALQELRERGLIVRLDGKRPKLNWTSHASRGRVASPTFTFLNQRRTGVARE